MKGNILSLLVLATLTISCVVAYEPSCQVTDLILYLDDDFVNQDVTNVLNDPERSFPNTRFGAFQNGWMGMTWSKSQARSYSQQSSGAWSATSIQRLTGLWDGIVANCDPAHKIVVLVGSRGSYGNPDGIPQALNFIQMMKDNTTFDITFVLVTSTNHPEYIGKIASEPSAKHTIIGGNQIWWGLSPALGNLKHSGCTLMGDSRIVTFDGASYVFNGIGEYTMFSGSYDVSVRMMPCTGISPGTYSCVQSVAMVATASPSRCAFIISYDRDTNTLTFGNQNGLVSPLSYYQDCFPYVGFWGLATALNNADNSNQYRVEVWVQNYVTGDWDTSINLFFGQDIPGVVSISTNSSYIGATSGLCGIADGCTDNDFFTSNGGYLSPASSAQDIYEQFVLSWVAKRSDFLYGPNEAAYIKYYADIALSYVPNLSTLTNPTAAASCAYFSDKSQFLYDSCTTAVATGFTGVVNTYTYLLDKACESYCTSQLNPQYAAYPAYGPNVMVNPAYCAPRCDFQNTIDLHQDYNSTNLPPNELQYSNALNSATFHGSIGGTYTFAYELYCPNENATSTISIVCDAAPVVNAGEDRVVTRYTLGTNYYDNIRYIESQWPAVRLWGEASDVNQANLIYSWAVIGVPNYPQTNDPVSDPYIDFAADRHAILYAVYPGTYTLELAVFDGCSIAKDTVSITLACDNCATTFDISVTKPFSNLYFHWEQITGVNFWTENFNTYMSSTSYSYNQNFEADYYYDQTFVEYVSNTNNYDADIIDLGSQYKITFYQATADVLINTTSTTTTGNFTVNGLSTATPLTDGIRIWRYEAQSRSTIATTTTTVTETTTSLYSTLAAHPHNKCTLIYDAINNDGVSNIWVDTDFSALPNDPFGTRSECFGTYTFKKSFFTMCSQANVTQDITLACARAPVAYLTTCTKSLPYNYVTGFPTVSLDARDTFKFDSTSGGQGSNILMRYEFTNMPANSGLNRFITSAPQCTNNYQGTVLNAYIGCNQVDVTPDYGGSYTVQLTASNGCASTTATTTFTIVCDPLTSYIAGQTTLNNNVGSTVDLANIYVSNHTVSTSWALVAGDSNYVSFNTPSTLSNVTLGFSMGGTYTFEATSDDGCWRTVATHTVNYVCVSTITPSVSPAPAALTYPYGRTLDASASTSSAGLPLSFGWRIVSVPAHSNVLVSGTYVGGATFNLLPDVTGSYTVELAIYDGCQIKTYNYTYTTTNCANYFDSNSITLSVEDQNNAAQSNFVWNGIGTALTITGVVTNLPYVSWQWELYDAVSGTLLDSTFGGTTYDVVNALSGFPVNGHFVGSYQLKFWAYGDCSYGEKTISFGITCGTVPVISFGTVSPSNFVAGKFDRVSITPSVTQDAARPFPTYLTGYNWYVVDAPSTSVFYPSTTYTVSQTVVNATAESQISTNPEVWEVVDTVTTTWTYTTVHKEIRLTYNDAGDLRDACFTPDAAGIYTLMFKTPGYCYDTISATTTVTTNCNAAPTVLDVTSTVDYKNSFLQLNAQIATASATDADGDDLYYTWSWSSVPAGSVTGNSTALTTIKRNSVFFYPDYPGTWVLDVTVTDGCTPITRSVSIDVSCSSQPAIGFAQPSQSLTFDGYVPVTFKEFILTATPGCTANIRNQNGAMTLALVDFTPSVPVPPPSTTTGEPTSAASNLIAGFALIAALIALIF